MTVTLESEYRAFESLLESGVLSRTLKVLTHTPSIPVDNEVVFSLENGLSEEENRSIVSKDRTYQLLFFVADKFEAMNLHSEVEQLMTETASIPCGGRYIKITNVAMSRIFTTESGKEAFICMVDGEYKVGRTFAQAPLMANLNATVNE